MAAYEFLGQIDLDLVLPNWGDGVLPEGYAPNAVPGGGPFDGVNGHNDLDGVLLSWGNGTRPVVTIPESSTLAAAGFLGLAGLTRWRSR